MLSLCESFIFRRGRRKGRCARERGREDRKKRGLGREGRRVGATRKRASRRERRGGKKKSALPYFSALFLRLAASFRKHRLFSCASAEPVLRGAHSAPMTAAAAAAARVSARRRGGVGSRARGTSTMSFAAIATMVTMATLITRASAFYLPGVAPQDFAMVSNG